MSRFPDLSNLHPVMAAALSPLFAHPLRQDDKPRAVWPAGLPEAENDERAWDDPIDDSDAQHDMRRDWALEEPIPVGEARDSDFSAFLEAL